VPLIPINSDKTPGNESDSFAAHAYGLLKELTGEPEAQFRDGQLEAIEACVESRDRVLLVQRTGWGKSAVYFIATQILRDRGSGPTLLFSPLLALMRNQTLAAKRMGLKAETLNSGNRSEWGRVEELIRSNEIDLLLISPERLANREFQEDILPILGSKSGLLVIDEAHCISDWGHDFRPDYKRIRKILALLPPNTPVLSCTATANDRVIEDISAQLGNDLHVYRGGLSRKGLRLHVLPMPSTAKRLAWLSETIPDLSGTGIIYCLTVEATSLVSDWLQLKGISAVSYSGRSDAEERLQIEQGLLENKNKVTVATSALGMGFDKPDLSFVIHFQSPPSPISYYQQIGRAGRSLDTSFGILLCGDEDKKIQDYFIESAFSPPELTKRVVEHLTNDGGWVSLHDLQRLFNIRPTRIKNLMKNLVVDGIVESNGARWLRTANPWAYDYERAQNVTALRRSEQQQMLDYTKTSGCRMAFLQGLLDDTNTGDRCNNCDNCTSHSLGGPLNENLVAEAKDYIQTRILDILPRKRYPTNKNIPKEFQLETGRSLSRYGDSGLSPLIQNGFAEGTFSDQLVQASAAFIQNRWEFFHPIEWVTFVPSLRSPFIVPQFAEKLASALGLPFQSAVTKIINTNPQKEMANSPSQFNNIKNAFEVENRIPSGPVLLIDDVVNSRWTFTVVGGRLLATGASHVYPFALSSTAING